MSPRFWTNPSVLELGHGRDPVEVITAEARAVVFDALERGWKGPPFDPFALAELRRIETVPRPDVLDARTVPLGESRFRIEYNPDRPHRRTRYSIFHEIAHTLFRDCGRMIRNRGVHNAARRDDWQLETLCNIAAAEFLLPTGALGEARNLRPSVDTILNLRERYESSAEAALLRITRLTTERAMAFSCHREPGGRYVIEYGAPTVGTDWKLFPGSLLPTRTLAAECTAIGYTAKQTEVWPRIGEVYVECVGIAPFPRDIYPRVIGFARPAKSQSVNELSIKYVRGDATKPRGVDRKLLVQVVNDTALTWGGLGFAAAVRRRWPSAQKEFTEHVTADKGALRLGSVVTSDVAPELTLASLVSQHGYGLSARPRIRYGALRDCLNHIAGIATRTNSSVHMPRIGTGQAGGSWPVVEEIITETLTRVGVTVVVYDLPQGRGTPKAQGDLALGT